MTQLKLRAMSRDEREEWMRASWRKIESIGMSFIKVQGRIATSRTEEDDQCAIERFHRWVDGPDIEPITGGMG